MALALLTFIEITGLTEEVILQEAIIIDYEILLANAHLTNY
jgi:energy-converting hydrogenase Eha subunit E